MVECGPAYADHDWHATGTKTFECVRCGLVDLPGSRLVRRLWEWLTGR